MFILKAIKFYITKIEIATMFAKHMFLFWKVSMRLEKAFFVETADCGGLKFMCSFKIIKILKRIW